MPRQSYQLKADFTEDTVSIAIAMLLTLVQFPGQRFTIEMFSRRKERWLGTDARIKHKYNKIRVFHPFYMQFKRPSSFLSRSTSKIVEDRKEQKLKVEPSSLFFSLQRKQLEHSDSQHNILYRLNRRLRRWNLGDAAYVCPLFLNQSTYLDHLHWSGVRRWSPFWAIYPWNYRPVRINQKGRRPINFNNVPVISEHVSILPHAQVQGTNHRYSFNDAGKDLCFHSPTSLPENAIGLGEFLNRIAEKFLDSDEEITPDTAFGRLSDLIEIHEDFPSVDGSEGTPLAEGLALDREDPIGNWLSWGDLLRSEYGIEQFALVAWTEH